MVTRLDASVHFVPRQALPEFDGSASMLEIFKDLAGRNFGAFIYRGPTGRAFVRAHRLAEKLFDNVNGDVDAARSAAGLSLDEALDRVGGPDVVLPVQAAVDVSDDALALQNRSDAVFPVVDDDKPLGWFLNHETVLDPATKRVYFYCTNPTAKHKNSHPDHGTCFKCPYPIGGTSP